MHVRLLPGVDKLNFWGEMEYPDPKNGRKIEFLDTFIRKQSVALCRQLRRHSDSHNYNHNR